MITNYSVFLKRLQKILFFIKKNAIIKKRFFVQLKLWFKICWVCFLGCAILCQTQEVLAFSAYSNKELEDLEKQFVQQINLAGNVIRLPLAEQYINQLGRQLAQAGHMKAPYFFIVISNEINAFAGPGGHIGVNTQLILASETENELAAVMAHEMSHVRLHHLYQMIEHQKNMRVPMLASVLAAAALGVLNPTLASGALMASLTGLAQDNINFVRSNEKSADRVGIGMLAEAGFDPRGMAGFFRKMQQSMRYYYTDNVPAILRSHPLDEERIAEAENRCSQWKVKNHQSSEAYGLFKELIRVTSSNGGKALQDYYHVRCAAHPSDQACIYGQALLLTKNNQFHQANILLEKLLLLSPNNEYYLVAHADSLQGEGRGNEAVLELARYREKDPDSYAITMAYAQALLFTNHADKAVSVLLKATWERKNDLTLCLKLAEAQAASHQTGYAYFTEAQCHLLQGQRRAAMRQLKLAKTMATKDKFLKARIEAKMDEVKAMED